MDIFNQKEVAILTQILHVQEQILEQTTIVANNIQKYTNVMFDADIEEEKPHYETKFYSFEEEKAKRCNHPALNGLNLRDAKRRTPGPSERSVRAALLDWSVEHHGSVLMPADTIRELVHNKAHEGNWCMKTLSDHASRLIWARFNAMSKVFEPFLQGKIVMGDVVDFYDANNQLTHEA